jgi:hypothetical protein
MSDTNNRPKQDGSLRGQNTGPLPKRGSETGVTDTYGADLGFRATNRQGGFNADSNPANALPGKDMPNPADKLGGGAHGTTPGRSFSADSDPVYETERDTNTAGNYVRDSDD